MLERLLHEAAESMTLAECIERANPLLGLFGFPPDLAFALEAHLAWLERTHRVHRVQRDSVVAWELSERKL